MFDSASTTIKKSWFPSGRKSAVMTSTFCGSLPKRVILKGSSCRIVLVRVEAYMMGRVRTYGKSNE